jgi:hypothetical protein
LPERTWTDEEDVESIHTFETWGDSTGAATEQTISRKSLDGTMILIDLTVVGDGLVDATTISNINGVANTTPLTLGEARTLVQSAAYTTPEV